MKNRAKSQSPVSLQHALMAALSVEQGRTRDAARQAEIAAVIEALGKLWPQAAATPPPPAPVPAPAPPPAPVLAKDEQEDHEPEPVFLEVPQARGGIRQSSIQEILRRAASQPPAATVDARRQARERVKDAVARIVRLTNDEQLKYELALLVLNENLEAMGDMAAAARIEGLPVKDYARRIVAVHNARRRRAAEVYAIEAQALKDIDTAVGEAIETIAERAVKDILGDDA